MLMSKVIAIMKRLKNSACACRCLPSCSCPNHNLPLKLSLHTCVLIKLRWLQLCTCNSAHSPVLSMLAHQG